MTQKHIQQLINLLSHWSEVQHDNPDDDTPSEHYCDYLSDKLGRIQKNPEIEINVDFSDDEIKHILARCESDELEKILETQIKEKKEAEEGRKFLEELRAIG